MASPVTCGAPSVARQTSRARGRLVALITLASACASAWADPGRCVEMAGHWKFDGEIYSIGPVGDEYLRPQLGSTRPGGHWKCLDGRTGLIEGIEPRDDGNQSLFKLVLGQDAHTLRDARSSKVMAVRVPDDQLALVEWKTVDPGRLPEDAVVIASASSASGHAVCRTRIDPSIVERYATKYAVGRVADGRCIGAYYLRPGGGEALSGTVVGQQFQVLTLGAGGRVSFVPAERGKGFARSVLASHPLEFSSNNMIAVTTTAAGALPCVAHFDWVYKPELKTLVPDVACFYASSDELFKTYDFAYVTADDVPAETYSDGAPDRWRD